MELEDESFDMTIFDKIMECKHNGIVNEIVIKIDGSMSIENTNN
jgi:hypothetical protein